MSLMTDTRKTAYILWLVIFFATPIWASEEQIVSTQGNLALKVDAYSFRGGEGAFEEVIIRFPAAYLAFESQDDTLFVGRYRPHLEIRNEQGAVIKKVGGERVFTAKTRDVGQNVFVYDLTRFQLPAGYYHAVLDVEVVGNERTGRAVFPLEVPAYETGQLALSDLFFVDHIDLPDHLDGASFDKGGRILLPALAREIKRGESLWWYAELYEIGRLAHTVDFSVTDRLGHRVFTHQRAFSAYRENATFFEGLPLPPLPPGSYSLEVKVLAGQQMASAKRAFQISGDALDLSPDFTAQRQAVAGAWLKQVDPSAGQTFEGLSGEDRALFLYGFWLAKQPLVAEVYAGPVTGLAHPVLALSQLNVLGHDGLLKKRVDRSFGERLPEPDTLAVRLAHNQVDWLLKKDKSDPYALVAKSLLALANGALAEGEDYVRMAFKTDGDLPIAHYAQGITKIGRKDWQDAAAQFEKAEQVAYAELAYFLSGKGNEDDELGAIKKALLHDPSHPWLHYVLGRVLERRGDLAQSADAYAQQLKVNALHGRAQFDLGRVLFKAGHIDSATVMWRTLMEARPDFRRICIYPLLDAYLNTGETGKAQALIGEELRTLDPEVRAQVEDISLVAGPDEMAEYNSLDEEGQRQYVRAFWQKRDPTPATPGNERLVEHYRRVIYALQNFSKDGKVWDRRGNIYIRYGQPRHVSKRGDIRYETDQEVVRVKERLLNALSPEAKQEIIARATRLRTSTRDVEIEGDHAETVTVSDFESIDFEMNPNRVFFSTDTDDVQRYVRGKELFGRDRLGASEQTIRGLPLYPVNGTEPWEYWIYPDIGGGIEVVFTALTSGGDFDFPNVSEGRKIAQFNQRLWEDTRPEVVVSRAVKDQPDRYIPVGKGVVDFHFASADFRGAGDRSRLEVYYGVPVLDLIGESEQEAVFERGIALFDSSWVPIYRKVAPMAVVVDRQNVESGTLAIDELALQIRPGRYYLGVQVNHPKSDRRGGYTQELVVEDYTLPGLQVSDIELAGLVVQDSTLASKGGLQVTPLPSRTYKLGKPIVIYYEVYGLTGNDFGQTNYRVDYRITPKKGKLSGVQVLRALGRLIGIEEKAEVTISYERTGTKTDEHNYLEIDPGKSKEGRYEITVTVTDLNAEQTAEKSVILFIGK